VRLASPLNSTAAAPASSSPRGRLPPLNAIRAFEAAARLGGFNAAGAELNVSANAVGRLVKLLEDSLSVPLFRRLARGVVLTEAGERYLAGVGTLLDRLAEATTDLQRLETPRVLKVSAAPSVISRWLIPRLRSLTERHPDLDVHLTATIARTDFTREDIDVAVRVGTGCYEGMRSDLLMRIDRFPVCAPELLSRGLPLREPADLAHHVLLQDQSPCRPRLPDLVDWKRWLAAIGITNIDAERGTRFSFPHMALQAAAAGQGIALASSALIADDLTTGRLVRPFGNLAVPSPYGYFLVCPAATAEREKVVMFREWALTEAAAGGCASPPP